MAASDEGNLLPQLVQQLLFVRDEIPNIKTLDFINLIEHVVVIFDKLGAVLAFAKADMVIKCASLRSVADKCPTLKDIYEADKATKTLTKKGSNARNLHRLTGVLSFLRLLLMKLIEDPVCTTGTAASYAYEQALAPAHTFMIKSAVRAGMYVLPGRVAFMASLGVTDDSARESANTLVISAQPVVDAVLGLYKEKMPV
eukprot:gene22696-29851_t